MCGRVSSLFAAPPLAGGVLAVDHTGVGRPVVDMLRKSGVKGTLRPVTITAGHAASQDGRGGWLVPKKDLVGTMQVLLQQRRLQVAPELAEADTLVRELLGFEVKVTAAANETFGAWREGRTTTSSWPSPSPPGSPSGSGRSSSPAPPASWAAAG